MKKLIMVVVLFILPLAVLAGEKYCVIGSDPVDVKRQPVSGEVIVLTDRDIPIKMKGGKGGIREYSCILPAGSPAVVNVDDINRCPKWIYRCGNPIVTSPCLGPKIFKEQHVETQVETMVIAQAPTTHRLVHPMARPCFDCGLSAPKGSWEYQMNEAVVGFTTNVPYAVDGYFIGDGIKKRKSDVVSANAVASARAGGGRVTPVYRPVPATAPPPTVYIPTGGNPSSAVAPPPGPSSW